MSTIKEVVNTLKTVIEASWFHSLCLIAMRLAVIAVCVKYIFLS
jgi:hypothetical protein